jgi:putative addiction module component (TIGR02574 family)
MPTIQELGIDSLNVQDRLRLIGEIWESLSLDSEPVPESHRRELDRRLDASEAAVKRDEWEVVQQRLRNEK